MRKTQFDRQRKWFAIGILAVIAIALIWHFSPGLPVLFGPYASASTRAAGQELFTHEWQPNDLLARADGLGPVFNAKSCVACHNQGGVGGGGSNEHNITNFEVIPNDRDGAYITGTIHSDAVADKFRESFTQARAKFPVIKGRTRTNNSGGCSMTVTDPDVEPLRTTQVQSTALFGAGWIDLISSKAILKNRRGNLIDGVVREFSLDFDAIPAGRARILSDGRVGKFGWKAQFATLEEFVAAACANELGLGTPLSEQAKPIGLPYPDMKPDMTRKQFKQLVAFVDTLPKPIEAERSEAAERGKQLFSSVGCAVCHVPSMGGVRGVYSDFLLHKIVDPTPGGTRGGSYAPPVPDAPLPKDRPHEDEWRTPPLWGVADSAPYMHDGSAKDLDEAILRHGGDGKIVRETYRKLNMDDQRALVEFLKTLRAPPDAIPTSQK